MCLYVCLFVCLLVTTMNPTKQLNRSRCHLGYGLGWVQETMYFVGARISPGRWAILRAPPRQKSLTTCCSRSHILVVVKVVVVTVVVIMRVVVVEKRRRRSLVAFTSILSFLLTHHILSSPSGLTPRTLDRYRVFCFHSVPGGAAERTTVTSMSVCPSFGEHISETTRPVINTFCACCLWPWLGPAVEA